MEREVRDLKAPIIPQLPKGPVEGFRGWFTFSMPPSFFRTSRRRDFQEGVEEDLRADFFTGLVKSKTRRFSEDEGAGVDLFSALATSGAWSLSSSRSSSSTSSSSSPALSSFSLAAADFLEASM